jgi:hypothetical protein
MACLFPGATPNSGNCGPALGQSSEVGTYTASASPAGTFDQGGTVAEITETISSGANRVYRGGHFFSNFFWETSASNRLDFPTIAMQNQADAASIIGFRIAATVPEPGTGLLLMMGLAGLARIGKISNVRA